MRGSHPAAGSEDGGAKLAIARDKLDIVLGGETSIGGEAHLIFGDAGVRVEAEAASRRRERFEIGARAAGAQAIDEDSGGAKGDGAFSASANLFGAQEIIVRARAECEIDRELGLERGLERREPLFDMRKSFAEDEVDTRASKRLRHRSMLRERSPPRTEIRAITILHWGEASRDARALREGLTREGDGALGELAESIAEEPRLRPKRIRRMHRRARGGVSAVDLAHKLRRLFIRERAPER